MTEIPPRIVALLHDAADKAERIYRRTFPDKHASLALIVDKLDADMEALCKELVSTKILLRQRAAVTLFLSRWEKACAEEAAR